MYFPLNMVIFEPAMLVYWRVRYPNNTSWGSALLVCFLGPQIPSTVGDILSNQLGIVIQKKPTAYKVGLSRQSPEL